RYVRRFPGRSTLLLVVALSVAGATTMVSATPGSPAASSLPAPADAIVRSGLKELHEGLYAKAEESFRQAARAAPGDPAPDLFIAFTFRWRMIQHRSDRSLDEAFLGAASHVVETRGHMLATKPGDVGSLDPLGLRDHPAS